MTSQVDMQYISKWRLKKPRQPFLSCRPKRLLHTTLLKKSKLSCQSLRACRACAVEVASLAFIVHIQSWLRNGYDCHGAWLNFLLSERLGWPREGDSESSLVGSISTKPKTEKERKTALSFPLAKIAHIFQSSLFHIFPDIHLGKNWPGRQLWQHSCCRWNVPKLSTKSHVQSSAALHKR